jgi:hypothetical protein
LGHKRQIWVASSRIGFTSSRFGSGRMWGTNSKFGSPAAEFGSPATDLSQGKCGSQQQTWVTSSKLASPAANMWHCKCGVSTATLGHQQQFWVTSRKSGSPAANRVARSKTGFTSSKGLSVQGGTRIEPWRCSQLLPRNRRPSGPPPWQSRRHRPHLIGRRSSEGSVLPPWRTGRCAPGTVGLALCRTGSLLRSPR